MVSCHYDATMTKWKSKGTLHPFDVDLSLYERHEYRIVVRIEVFHDQIHGLLRPGQVGKPQEVPPGFEGLFRDLKEAVPGRYYMLTYEPEFAEVGSGKAEDMVLAGLNYWRAPKKERINKQRLSIAFVSVRRAYNLVLEALGASYIEDRPLFSAKDVLRCFPWVSASVLHHRVSKGYIPLKGLKPGKGPGRGVPIMFTLPEVVHCGVVDELASLGVFGDLNMVNTMMVWPE